MKLHFLTILLLLIIGTSYSQEKQQRLEFDLKDDFENELVFPLGKDGLLIQSFGTNSQSGEILLKNEFYSTDLQLVKTRLISVKQRTSYAESCDENGVNYTLIRNKRDYFAIIKADAKTQTCTKVEGEYSDDATLTRMKVFGNKAIFKSVENNVSKIIIIDLLNGKSIEVPFKFGDFRRKDITIEDFQVIENEILVFVNAATNRKTEDLYIAKLNLDGEQQDFYPITNNVAEKLISVTATRLNDKYIITGTYAKGKSDMSQGLFIGEVSERKLNFIKFYNFLSLNNFTKYLPERQQKKVERKKEAKEEQGKELLMNYNIATHPIKLLNDGYEFLGEAYYPVYS